MKYFLLVSLLSGFVSCTSYRYLKLDSPDLTKNKDNGFTESTDSLEVNYHFYGNKGPLHLTIFNRMNHGMQVDFSRSALIMNDKAISLYSGDIQLNGTMDGHSIEWTKNFSSLQGSISAKASLPQAVLFIPAHTYIDVTPITLTNQFFDTIPASKFVKSDFLYNEGLSSRVIKTASFNQSESPLAFKTYLTFISQEPAHKEFVQQHSFYVSEIVKAACRPGDFGYMQSPNGDKFYVSRTHGNGAGTGLLVATALAASVTAATHPKGSK